MGTSLGLSSRHDNLKSCGGINKQILGYIICVVLQFEMFTSLSVTQVPTLYYQSNLSIFTNNTSQDLITNLLVNDYYIIRQSLLGKLDIYSKANKNLIVSVLSGTNYLTTLKCLEFDIQQQNRQQLLVLTNNKQIVKFNLTTPIPTFINLFLPAFNNNYFDLQVIKDQLIILAQTNNNYKYRIDRYKNISLINGVPLTKQDSINLSLGNTNIGNFKIKTCDPGNNFSHYILVVWRSHCELQIFNCSQSLISCVLILQYSDPLCSLSDYISSNQNIQLSFSMGCSFLAFQNSKYSIYKLQNNLAILNSSFDKIDPTNSVKLIFRHGIHLFLDVIVREIGVVRTFIIGSNLTQYIDDVILQSLGCFSVYNNDFNLISATDIQIKLYKPICPKIYQTLDNGICIGCCQNCYSCNIFQSNCLVCDNGYNLNNNTCSIIIQNQSFVQNETQSNTTQTNSSIINDSTQQTISKLVSTSITSYIGVSTSTITYFLQYFPFSFLFMGFINFWTTCTFYLFIGVKMPTDLKDILKTIYNQINQSPLGLLGIHINVQTNLKEKQPQNMVQDYQVTSDFFNANLEQFIILIWSYITLGFMYWLKKSLPHDNFVRNKLKRINYPLAIIGQYTSMMSSFYFNLPCIIESSYQSSFLQKINILLVVLFILLSSLMPLLVIIMLQKPKLELPGSHQRTNQVFKQQLQWFYSCSCNSLMPFLVFINLPLFLIINPLIYAVNIWAAFKQKHYKFSYVLLASYSLLFHCGVVLVVVCQYNQILYKYASIFTMIVLFLGAIHQTLALVSGLLYDIVLYFIKRNKVQDSSDFKPQKPKKTKMLCQSRVLNGRQDFLIQQSTKILNQKIDQFLLHLKKKTINIVPDQFVAVKKQTRLIRLRLHNKYEESKTQRTTKKKTKFNLLNQPIIKPHEDHV